MVVQEFCIDLQELPAHVLWCVYSVCMYNVHIHVGLFHVYMYMCMLSDLEKINLLVKFHVHARFT